MRQLTQMEDEGRARLLADALVADGIEARVETARAGGYHVWVENEDDLPRARAILAELAADPNGPRFAAATERAREKRRVREKAQTARAQTVRIRDRWAAAASTELGPISVGMIVVAVAIGVWTRVDLSTPPVALLEFDMRAILHGEVWRLFSTLFVHQGFLHIVFNLLWLRELGGMVERLQSSIFFAVLALGCGALAAVAQWYLTGASAVGLSGVNYALLGYIWVRARLDPISGYTIHPSRVVWMLGWLVICFTGVVGPIANVAHVAGLLLGVAIAAAVSKGPRWMRR